MLSKNGDILLLLVNLSPQRTFTLYPARNTPLKTNMEPENAHLEKEKHLQTINFWVPS